MYKRNKLYKLFKISVLTKAGDKTLTFKCILEFYFIHKKDLRGYPRDANCDLLSFADGHKPLTAELLFKMTPV